MDYLKMLIPEEFLYDTPNGIVHIGFLKKIYLKKKLIQKIDAICPLILEYRLELLDKDIDILKSIEITEFDTECKFYNIPLETFESEEMFAKLRYIEYFKMAYIVEFILLFSDLKSSIKADISNKVKKIKSYEDLLKNKCIGKNIYSFYIEMKENITYIIKNIENYYKSLSIKK